MGTPTKSHQSNYAQDVLGSNLTLGFYCSSYKPRSVLDLPSHLHHEFPLIVGRPVDSREGMWPEDFAQRQTCEKKIYSGVSWEWQAMSSILSDFSISKQVFLPSRERRSPYRSYSFLDYNRIYSMSPSPRMAGRDVCSQEPCAPGSSPFRIDSKPGRLCETEC